MFWILAAAMLLGALAFVLTPLLSTRSRDPHDRARSALRAAHAAGALSDDELAGKLAQLPAPPQSAAPSRRFPIVLALVLPFAAIGLYQRLGEPRALDPAATAATAAAVSANDADSTGEPAPDMSQAVAGLAERLKKEPDDIDGWLLLGRAYKTMERFDEALAALANAQRLAPTEPDVMLEYAEALALASATHRIEGEALKLLEQVLAQDANNQRALWLRGIAAMQQDSPRDAAGYWERLLAQFPADAEPRVSLIKQINEARAAASLPPLAEVVAPRDEASAAPTVATANAATPNTASVTSTKLTVKVDISAKLRDRVGASDVLFVFARAPSGPRMPLAIQRVSASSLPATITLDDSTSMLPSMTLSSLPEVVVGARISKSGQAMPQSGDLQTLSAPLSTSRRDPIALLIDEEVP